MTNNETTSLVIIIASTSECFEVRDVPLTMTVKELLDEFIAYRNLDSKHEIAWKFLFGSSIVDSGSCLYELFNNSDDKCKTLQLIAKVEGA